MLTRATTDQMQAPNPPIQKESGLRDLVTIVLVTRNRPELVRDVIGRLRGGPLADLPIIVVDDASDVPVRVEGPGVTLSRNATRKGLVLSRTGANLSSRTEFVLSLDDDSWPKSGDLRAAVAYLRSQPDVLALSFPIRNKHGRWQLRSLASKPYPVRGFVGCAHLMRVEHFRALGGYGTAVVHQGEELELAARGFLLGKRCVHFPGFVVHHDVTPVSRDVDRMLFHDGRNKVRFLRTFCPRMFLPWRLFKTLIEMVIFSWRNRRLAPLRGWREGMLEKMGSDVPRFTGEQWSAWRSVPYV